MHDRISINALCFMGTPFSELATYWRELGACRVGLVTSLLFEEGIDAAQAALGTGTYKVEVLSHQFLVGHLSSSEATWREPRERLSRVIEYASIARCAIDLHGDRWTWQSSPSLGRSGRVLSRGGRTLRV